VASEIPRAASLVAQDRLYPHLSHRETMSYIFAESADAEYVMLDVAQAEFTNTDNVHNWLRQQIAQRTDYGIVDARDGYILLRRGAPHTDLPPAFYSFAQAGDHPAISQPMRAQFGGELEFLGFDLATERDREVTLVTYWRVLRDGIPDRLPNLYLLDASGRNVAETRFAQPGLVWLPTGRWPADQVVRLVFNTLTWTTEGMDRYQIALSVLDQPDPLRAKRALVITAPDSRDAARLLNGNTMFRLGEFSREWGLTRLER